MLLWMLTHPRTLSHAVRLPMSHQSLQVGSLVSRSADFEGGGCGVAGTGLQSNPEKGKGRGPCSADLASRGCDFDWWVGSSGPGASKSFISMCKGLYMQGMLGERVQRQRGEYSLLAWVYVRVCILQPTSVTDHC